MPSYEKPKQPEIKFELGLTHVQAWSQFERTGTMPALINALRVTCKYKKPVYWRERLSNDKYCPSVEKYNFRSEHPGDFRAVLFQLTTTGVLAREQARRKSRRFNEYDNYGPDGPEFPGF